MDILFTNSTDSISFLNIIAQRRLNNLTRDNETFQAEIEEALSNCGEICSKHGSDTNFVREIIALDAKMDAAERKSINSRDVSDLSLRRESLYDKYNQFLASIPLEDKENLEFAFKQVLDRIQRISVNDETMAKISLDYPDAKSVTPEERKNHRVFRSINAFLYPEMEAVEEKEEEKNDELPYVVKISAAKDDLIEAEIEEPVGEIAAPETDNSFYQDGTDDFITQVDNEYIPHEFKEVKEPEVDKIAEVEEEVPKVPEEIAEDTDVTFTIEKGISLTDIAIALCGDENGWYDLYNANKDAIDNKLTEAGLSHDEPFESNDEVFDGLVIKIPNQFNKVEEQKQLAA